MSNPNPFDRLVSRLPKPATQWGRMLGLALFVGVLSGLAAAVMERGLHLGADILVGRFAHLGGAGTFTFKWGVLLLPAVGGLVSGLLVRACCPAATQQGTDALTRAFHRDLGVFPLRGPAVHAAAAVGVISSGGSTGPEGPMAALGAALGSSLGGLFRVTPRERRILLVCGCAGGVGAIFQCPLGGALFAAGVLYRDPDFESDAIVPSFVCSVIAYSTFMLVPGSGYGEHLLAGAEQLKFASPRELIPYALLGPLCGALSILFSRSLTFIQHNVVPRLHMPPWLTPALGGLATGAIACVLPQVMDGQYRFIQNAMDGSFFPPPDQIVWWRWTALFAAVMVVKCIASAITVGSGASGGVLGPAVFIGGAAGAFLGAACETVYPGVFPEPLRMALIPVGMGGVLAAGMGTPLAAIVMVTEMTGGYGLIVPLMLVCGSAYIVGSRWGLNHEQVRSAAESPAHAGDAIVHMLETWRVDELMERNWPQTVRPETTLGELVQAVQPGTRPVFAVSRDRDLVGLVSVPDIQRVMEEPAAADAVIAADMMTERLTTIRPDVDVYHALTVFERGRHSVLPVVDPARKPGWVGMLTRQHVFDAVQQRIAAMQKVLLREHAGLAAMQHEGQLHLLVAGVSQEKTDRIQRLIVPIQAVGQSLRQADFRRQFGAQVIAIEQPDGRIQCPPDLDAPLHTDQRLVAIVWDTSAPAHPTTEPDEVHLLGKGTVVPE